MTTWAMVDLETTATMYDARVLTIGAVKFDPFSWRDTHSDFYMRLEIEDQEACGRRDDPNTLDWWGRQDPAAIEEAFGDNGDRVAVIDMLRALKKWYVGCDGMWSQGNMDIVILEHMCDTYGEPIPWAHWQVGDSRSILRRMATDPRGEAPKFLAHHALEDAKAQVWACRKAFQHFNMTR